MGVKVDGEQQPFFASPREAVLSYKQKYRAKLPLLGAIGGCVGFKAISDGRSGEENTTAKQGEKSKKVHKAAPSSRYQIDLWAPTR